MSASGSNCSTNVFYVHRLGQYVVNYVQLGVRVIFKWSAHDLSPRLPDWVTPINTIYMSVTFPLVFHL